MKPIIEVENLGKSYRVGRENAGGGYSTLRETISSLAKAPLRRIRGAGETTSEFWALRDVNFTVQPGEVLGVIGRNGAGKSTLLKIISRITRPSTGEARLHGRVGSLLEVGTGFHPELTGRENVFLNGAILGMSRVEIKAKFDEIVAFAGVEQFLDTPIKRYSSGMSVRLAFAVAAHLEPEILLVDEVLAVGDQSFQKKCIGRMGDIASSGRTILLVSHDLPMLSRLCTKAIWIEKGTVAAWGQPTEVIDSYCESVNALAGSEATVSLADHKSRRPGMQKLMRKLALRDAAGDYTTTVPIGGTLTVDLQLAGTQFHSDSTVMIYLCDIFGSSLGQIHSKVQGSLDLGGHDKVTVRCHLEDLRLVPGEYTLSLAVGDSSNNLDRVDGAIGFTVLPTDIFGTGKMPQRKHGAMALAARWEIPDTDAVTSRQAVGVD